MITEVRSAIDTTSRQLRPTTVYGALSWMTLVGPGTDERRAFIYLDPPFPVDASVADAKVYVTTKNLWGTAASVTVRRISTEWAEDSLTHDLQPSVAGASVVKAVAASTPANTVIEINVTTLLQEAAAGSPFYGLRLTIASTDYKQLHSAEASDAVTHPYMIVDWSSAPEDPTDLKPGGARIVSLAQPTFQWLYSDADGDNQSAYEFQLDDAADFATPLVATGYVVSADAEKVLTEVSLAEATTYYWRVRVKDSSGVASDWSDTASFSRDTKGVLTLTNPAADPNDFVEETTPPITHTFTGETQAQAQHLIYESVDGGAFELIHDTGRRAWTSATYTLPEDIIVAEESIYKVVVRVWDNEARETTPGDPTYVEVSREFTYADSATPAVVPSVIVTADATPALTVEWTRSTAPDYFAIRYWRSGVAKKWAHTRLVPADVFVLGTTYSKKLWELDPAYTWTIEVQAVVLDGGVYKHSTGNDTDTGNPRPGDAWLIVPGRDIYVPIFSADQQDYQYGQDAQTKFPRGSQIPVRLTNAIRGVEGTISGGFCTFNGISGKTYRRYLENIILWAARGEVVRLVHADRSFPILLGDVSCPPQPETGNDWYAITLEFWQAGEFPIKVR